MIFIKHCNCCGRPFDKTCISIKMNIGEPPAAVRFNPKDKRQISFLKNEEDFFNFEVCQECGEKIKDYILGMVKPYDIN